MAGPLIALLNSPQAATAMKWFAGAVGTAALAISPQVAGSFFDNSADRNKEFGDLNFGDTPEQRNLTFQAVYKIVGAGSQADDYELLDKNADGKISRSEVFEKGFFDRPLSKIFGNSEIDKVLTWYKDTPKEKQDFIIQHAKLIISLIDKYGLAKFNKTWDSDLSSYNAVYNSLNNLYRQGSDSGSNVSPTDEKPKTSECLGPKARFAEFNAMFKKSAFEHLSDVYDGHVKDFEYAGTTDLVKRAQEILAKIPTREAEVAEIRNNEGYPDNAVAETAIRLGFGDRLQVLQLPALDWADFVSKTSPCDFASPLMAAGAVYLGQVDGVLRLFEGEDPVLQMQMRGAELMIMGKDSNGLYSVNRTDTYLAGLKKAYESAQSFENMALARAQAKGLGFSPLFVGAFDSEKMMQILKTQLGDKVVTSTRARARPATVVVQPAPAPSPVVVSSNGPCCSMTDAARKMSPKCSNGGAPVRSGYEGCEDKMPKTTQRVEVESRPATSTDPCENKAKYPTFMQRQNCKAKVKAGIKVD